ncbi:response regulator, partial [Halalkalibacterium halodurans]
MYDVMIVDDEAMVREGLKALISWEEYGFRVIDTARNGKEGFTKYRQLSPDLMIVDIRMPEVDGLSLIESIRAED